MRMNLPEIHTERLILRPATPTDAPAVADYYVRNREHLRPWDPKHPPGFLTEAYWRERIERNIDEFFLGISCRFFLFQQSDPALVAGHAGFSQIFHGSFHACYLGYTLDEGCQGKGLMYEGLSAAIDYMFRVRKLHRIMANYMPHNIRSGRLLRRLGFVVEGYARDYLMINGKWEDHVLTSLTNEKWEEE